MRSRHIVPTVGSLLRWGGLLAVVLAVVGGILGMHVIGGAQAAPMTAASMSGAVEAPVVATPPVTGSVHAMPADGVVAGPGGPSQVGPLTVCGCMAMHGACVPSLGAAVLSVPLPSGSTQLSSPAVLTAMPGHKSSDRFPDPPSLNQLSISRT
ncbi:DUF6153 family protein [Arthrobacter cryoconiti]|uniref:DUF6153 family protein n=1 Tax=Arthrobacter cryoconiti TaxID=748907 RepID=A0ABV8R410_9MICC|nr:DUF6153 family protein [Arthrobacter cryoconiti]MCC9069387.1 DUF6153 family protein [Arthrobacter cryoconiti]